MQREHADEVHAPDSKSQRQRAAVSPESATRALTGMDPLRNLDGDVGAERRNGDRQNDESRVVGRVDHA